MFLNDKWISSETLQLQTDAATTKGFAGVFGKRWFCGNWPDHLQSCSINVMELYPIAIAIELWGHYKANHKIIIILI